MLIFFLILWPGINVDSHVVLTVFHFVTVNIVKRKVLFQGYTWCSEGRIENRSFPGSRISACDRFRIPNFLIFKICFSSFHLFIISAIYYNHSYLFTLKTSDRKLKLRAKSRLPWKQEQGEEKKYHWQIFFCLNILLLALFPFLRLSLALFNFSNVLPWQWKMQP